MSSDDTRLQPVVGPEGLAITLAGLAQQVGAIEKAADLKVESLRREMAAMVLADDRWTGAEIQRFTEMIAAVKAEAKADNDGIHREIDLAKAAVFQMGRDQWGAHTESHQAKDRADDAALAAMNHRLEGMNEFRAQINELTRTLAPRDVVDTLISSIASRLESEKVDTRLRFEKSEAKINALEKEMGRELRAEVRPVQDARVGQLAVVSAVVIGISILSVVIVVANYLSTH
jgi:hypothetical protein